MHCKILQCPISTLRASGTYPYLLQLKQTNIPSHALQALNDDAITPKTPVDEGKEYFLSERSADERPICVYQLRSDPDGGANKDQSHISHIFCVSLDAGTPASIKNGMFKTDFSLDGGVFERNKFVERELPSNFSKPNCLSLMQEHSKIRSNTTVKFLENALKGQKVTLI
ncbi:hypothetical protein EDB19DRAFT_1693809 [Suillus lakei]|nr:hypothetical protein EDB19DRAFT_1693809 [Suillus lakei]